MLLECAGVTPVLCKRLKKISLMLNTQDLFLDTNQFLQKQPDFYLFIYSFTQHCTVLYILGKRDWFTASMFCTNGDGKTEWMLAGLRIES